VVAVMPASTRHRGNRNSPFPFEELFGRVHRSAIGSLWRWRTEFGLTSGLAGWSYWMAHVITATWTVIVLAGTTGLLTLIPHTRRWLTGRFWCLVTRHRLQRLCWEARLHTRSGRLPLILRIRPTEVGERALIWCRAGICAEDFEDRTDEIRSACLARDARVARDQRRSQLITIDVIRRDTLHASRHVAPQITPGIVPGRTGAVNGKTGVIGLASRLVAGIPRWLRRIPARS
jgi:hypothetical protein